MKRSMMHKKAVEWLDEAAKIATNQQCYYGSEEGTGKDTKSWLGMGPVYHSKHSER